MYWRKAGAVLLVKILVGHHHVVPGGVIGHEIHDDFHAALVGAGHELLVIVHGAVVRVYRVVIPDGIGAAELALTALLADGMNGHGPKDVDAQLVQFVQLAGEVAGGGKVARENFVDDAIPQPVRRGAGWESRDVGVRLGGG